MESSTLGIEHSIHAPQLVASIRTTIQTRKDVFLKIHEIITDIPENLISGKPFCIFYWVTTAVEGKDVEIGIPVSEKFASDTLEFRTLPKFETFSIKHKGPMEELGKTYDILFQYAYKFGYPGNRSYSKLKHFFCYPTLLYAPFSLPRLYLVKNASIIGVFSGIVLTLLSAAAYLIVKPGTETG